MRKFNSAGFGLFGIIIVVAIIGILTGGGLYWRETNQRQSQIQQGLQAEKQAKELRDKIMREQKQQLESIGENTSPKSTPRPSPQPTTAVDISNWKTYRNEKYGFEFKYPSNYVVVNDRMEIQDLDWYTLELEDISVPGKPRLLLDINPAGGEVFADKFYSVALGEDKHVKITSEGQVGEDYNPGLKVIWAILEVRSNGKKPSYSWKFYFEEGGRDYEPEFKEILQSFIINGNKN